MQLVATARGAVTWRNSVIVALSVIVVAVYCAGRSSKARDLSEEQYAANHLFLHDTLKLVDVRLKVDTLWRIKMVKAATVARSAHDTAADRVVTLVTSGETSIPASLVLPEIKTCEAALLADSLALASWSQSFKDAVTRGDYQTKRADMAEDQLKHAKPRFGFRSGVMSGIVVTAGLVRLLK